MSTELTTQKENDAALQAAQDFAELTGQFTANQILAMKRAGVIPPQAKGTDLEMFLYACKEMGANPITKQMYLLSRNAKKKDKYGNDVLDGQGRKMYEAHFYYVVDYKFLMAKCDETGEWGGHSAITYDEGMTLDQCVKKGIKAPRSAKVTVYRNGKNGTKAEATAEVSLTEYGSNSPNWIKMPFTMLGKVAMRKACAGAFPAATQGMYLEEEFDGPRFTASSPEITDQSGQIIDPEALTEAFRQVEAATTADEVEEVAKLHSQFLSNNAEFAALVAKRMEELGGGK